MGSLSSPPQGENTVLNKFLAFKTMHVMEKLIPIEERTDLPEKEMPTSTDRKIDDSDIPELPEKEPVVEGTKKPAKAKEVDEEDEPRIPQKRFDRIYAEKEEFKRQVEQSNQRVDRLAELLEKSLTTQQQRQIATTTPDKWKKILGEDNPLTDQFYTALTEELAEQRKLAREEAAKEWGERQTQETTQLAERSKQLENMHTEFADTVGIDPSTKEGDEQLAAILEIQDELTPTGADGKYSQPLIPLEAAYEIYKARQTSASAPQKENRLQKAAIVGAGRGDTDAPRNPGKGRPDPSGWRKFVGA